MAPSKQTSHTARIYYNKQDIILKNFLEAETEVSVSSIVTLAVEYHAVTGAYLTLGSVCYEDEHPGKKAKNIYIPPQTEAYRYLRSKQEEGYGTKSCICDIINNGITPCQEKTQIISLKDYIIYKNELTKLRSGNSTPVSKKEAVPKIKSPDTRTFTAESIKQPEKVAPKDVPQIEKPAEDAKDKVEKRPEKKRISFADSFIKSM